MIDDSSNDSNLVQRREDKRTLDRMRRKLATSGTMASKVDAPRQKSKSGVRIWPWAAAAVAVLIGINYALHTKQEKIVIAMGKSAGPVLRPPEGATLDDRVRFWAYAVYNVPKLKTTFKIPKGVLLDQKGARKNLEILLAEDVGAEVRNEVFAFQQNDPTLKAPPPKPLAAKTPNPKAKKR